MINPTRTFEVGQIASLPVYRNYSESAILGKLAHEAYDILENTALAMKNPLFSLSLDSSSFTGT